LKVFSFFAELDLNVKAETEQGTKENLLIVLINIFIILFFRYIAELFLNLVVTFFINKLVPGGSGIDLSAEVETHTKKIF
jgi:hypothetical protein